MAGDEVAVFCGELVLVEGGDRAVISAGDGDRDDFAGGAINRFDGEGVGDRFSLRELLNCSACVSEEIAPSTGAGIEVPGAVTAVEC